MTIVPEDDYETLLLQAFKAGDYGLTSELLVRMDQFESMQYVKNLYQKKLLRTGEASMLLEDEYLEALKSVSGNEITDEQYQLNCLAALKFPNNLIIHKNLIKSALIREEPDLAEALIDKVFAKNSSDTFLMNVKASIMHEKEDYAGAASLFRILHEKYPEDETIIKNLSASLTGLDKPREAIALLERTLSHAEDPSDTVRRLAILYQKASCDVRQRLTDLDNMYFIECGTEPKTRAHAAIMTFLQDFIGLSRATAKMLEFNPAPINFFTHAEVLFNIGEFDRAIALYEKRFEAHPHLEAFKKANKNYGGERLNQETLVVWFEQGIGEKLLFSYFLQKLARMVNNVTVVTDPRLIKLYKKEYKNWDFIDETSIKELPTADYHCASGDLVNLWLKDFVAGSEKFNYPLLKPDYERRSAMAAVLSKNNKKRIGISWRGGQDVSGKIRSMELSEILRAIPDDFDADIISFQYGDEVNNEIISNGDRRVQISGLDTFNDIDGVLALLSCCDAVLSVDNAVAHFASFLGVPTGVLIPAGQVQFRWKNVQLKNLFFPGTRTFVQRVPGVWAEPASDAMTWLDAILFGGVEDDA